MQKHSRSLLALALACSVAACQPGSTPVQNPAAIPAPKAQQPPVHLSPEKSFRVQFPWYIEGYCGSNPDETPGIALSCYQSGGHPIYDQIPTGNGMYCLSFNYCMTDNDDDNDKNKCKGICKIAGGGKNGLLSLELSTDYFSPNGDGVKDSVDITIEDPDNQGWTLEIRGGNSSFSNDGEGSETVTWNGGGQPEGKYNVVLIPKGNKNDKGTNLKLPLVLDVTPPVITYNQVNQPNGRSVFQVHIEDNLSGLDPDSTGVDLQGLEVTTLQEKINKRTANFKYQILPQPEPEAEPQGFQTQSLMPFSILQTLEDYDIGQAAINAADPAGNSSFMLAQVQVPKYNARKNADGTDKTKNADGTDKDPKDIDLDPGGNHREKCKTKSGDFSGSLKLAKVYDFDTSGPNLSFVFRYDSSISVPYYSMNNDPVQILNAQQLGIQNSNIKIAISGFNNTKGLSAMESALKLDAGSFRLGYDSRATALASPSTYPRLNRLFAELDPVYDRSKSSHKAYHKANGYHVVAVNMTDLYKKTYANGNDIYLSIRVGPETANVKVNFNKKQNRWDIYCAG